MSPTTGAVQDCLSPVNVVSLDNMRKWILLLRGINVGGNNSLPMKDLVLLLDEAGCTDVVTYIQSGNVILNSQASDAGKLSGQIAKSIFNNYGFEPKAYLVSPRELEAAVTANPFPDAVSNPKSLHLFFLAEPPSHANFEMLEALKLGSEEYALVGTKLYLHAPEGIGRSKLAANIERTLGVDATARNWRTVVKLLDLSKQPR